MEQGQTATPPMSRVVRWRYQTAVQAARMLSAAAPDRRLRLALSSEGQRQAAAGADAPAC